MNNFIEIVTFPTRGRKIATKALVPKTWIRFVSYSEPYPMIFFNGDLCHWQDRKTSIECYEYLKENL